MELKYVVPNMEKTFGNLEFAGESKIEQQRVNGRYVPVTRSYNLYSDVQRADDIIVTIPAKAGEKHFNIRGRGFTNYILLADDMLPVESK